MCLSDSRHVVRSNMEGKRAPCVVSPPWPFSANDTKSDVTTGSAMTRVVAFGFPCRLDPNVGGQSAAQSQWGALWRKVAAATFDSGPAGHHFE